MLFSFAVCIYGAAAATAAPVKKKEVEALISSSVDYKFGVGILKRFHETAGTAAQSAFAAFFRDGTNMADLFKDLDAYVPSCFPELKDVDSAFQRIYKVAQTGEVPDACRFLLQLKQVPLSLDISVLPAARWQSFADHLREKRYLQACMHLEQEGLTNDKLKTLLSFMLGVYCSQSDSLQVVNDLESKRQILAEKIKKTLMIVDDSVLRKQIKIDTNWLYLHPFIATVSLGIHQTCGAVCYWPGDLPILPIIGMLFTVYGLFRYWQLGNKKEKYSENVLSLQQHVSELACERAKEIISTCFICVFDKSENLFEKYLKISEKIQVKPTDKKIEYSIMAAIDSSVSA